jgi:tetratricopeptide (TPR) repeat protein/predicted Ser/Thr protein kinase
MISQSVEQIPQQIGPYKVLEPLGRGGMGEVLLAHDERLDRRVAIKRIRRDAASPDQRERFRREARLAARLSHSAIVQVHDLVTEGDVDNLVMEYVEGTNLRAVSRWGPLPVGEVLGLGIQIAQGLREAHRHGIVHRDLKTENVLVTPQGRAKIADFGVAKRLADAWNEESLTRTDAIVGTYRTMSPEQARGGPVDHRSDLFAFGVLLYEILTGQSPFQGENPLATLDRIVHHRQTPVREIDPDVPEELSRIVDRLLEKEPGLRPRSAGEVLKDLEELAGRQVEETGTATLVDAPPIAPPRRSRSLIPAAGLLAAALGIALAGGYLALRGSGEPLYVAVLEPEGLAGPEAGDLDLLGAAVRSSLLRGLLSLERISPKEAGPGSPASIARALAVNEVIGSRLDCRPKTCRLSLSRMRGDGSVLWAESLEIPTDDLFLVSNAVAGQIRRAYPDRETRPGSAELEASTADLRDYLRLRRQLESRSAGLGGIRQGLAAVRRRAPRFLDVYILEADVARHQFLASRDRADLEHGHDLIRQARSFAPREPKPLMILTDLALAENDLDKAEEAVRELEKLIPGDVMLLDRRAFLARRRGDLEAAIDLLREAEERGPAWQRVVNLAKYEEQAGKVEEARARLKRLLANDPGSPGQVPALSLLAQIELSGGSPERAVTLYRRLVEISPAVSERSNLGTALLLLRRYAEAGEQFRIAVAREPGNAFYALGLGDALWLLGRREEAEAVYRRVIELTEAVRPALSPQDLTVKGQALAHLGRGLEAVAAVQEALRLDPASAAVAYEASLVYTLLGETNSALVSAEKALKLGYHPRWFDFPWFDGLKRRSELAGLLAARSRPGS